MYADDNEACDPATNGADLTGKIAVLYRGGCEFGLKAYNAQQAGAIAAVVINNESGALANMRGGVQGPNVTIPVVMFSDIDVSTIAYEMSNGPVTVFIGNQAGYYAYDL